MKKRFLAAAVPAAVAMSMLVSVASATTGSSATISGSVGENVTQKDDYDGRHLRYVGSPAPDGYSEWYQHGTPYVLTASPEDGPVTMAGTIDVSGMTAAGQVAVIGLHDADALRAGDRGEKAEVGISIAYRGSGTYDIGVTDGEAAKGEFVQSFTRLSATDLGDGTVDVEFVVDGGADPAECASADTDVATADGCMTLFVDGAEVANDSYGTIVPEDMPTQPELSNGAHPGWYSAYAAGDGPEVGVEFDLTVTPVVLTAPETADDCRDGGYQTAGFKNQGLCVASVQANDRAGE